MTDVPHDLKMNGTPNLIELLESQPDPSSVWAREAGPASDDDPRFASRSESLGELSLCSDETSDLSGQVLADISVCSDEGASDSAGSDVRIKTDIERIGTTVYGLPLYHFRYKTGTERYRGVMAQDVLQVMPGAVTVGADGYYRVKYGELGISMTRA